MVLRVVGPSKLCVIHNNNNSGKLLIAFYSSKQTFILSFACIRTTHAKSSASDYILLSE